MKPPVPFHCECGHGRGDHWYTSACTVRNCPCVSYRSQMNAHALRSITRLQQRRDGVNVRHGGRGFE